MWRALYVQEGAHLKYTRQSGRDVVSLVKRTYMATGCLGVTCPPDHVGLDLVTYYGPAISKHVLGVVAAFPYIPGTMVKKTI